MNEEEAGEWIGMRWYNAEMSVTTRSADEVQLAIEVGAIRRGVRQLQLLHIVPILLQILFVKIFELF
jgi:hypothetical protein